MRLPLILLRRGDIPGILFVAGVTVVLICLYIVFPEGAGRQQPFGPDWDCQNVPNSDAICIKRIPKPR